MTKTQLETWTLMIITLMKHACSTSTKPYMYHYRKLALPTMMAMSLARSTKKNLLRSLFPRNPFGGGLVL